MFKCVNDRYDPWGQEPYKSVQEFLDMCKKCFGEKPDLTDRTGDGDYYDEKGEKVLIRWDK